MALLGANQSDEARAAFVAGLAELGEDEHAYRARLGALAGLAAMSTGDTDAAYGLIADARADALVAGAEALALNLALDQARAAEASGRLEIAAQLLADIRARDPANVAGWLYSAQTARAQGRFDEASAFLERGQALHPDDEELAIESALLARDMGDRDLARARFQAIVEGGGRYAPIARQFLDELDAPGAAPSP
jgi:tetratricopeptide (TPR) repeat protein